MPIHVVVGGPDDIDAAVDAFVRGATARSGRSMDASHVEETRDRIARNDSWFFIARDDESEPIGMAMAMPAGDESVNRPNAPGLCYLDLIFVVPERWGEAWGRCSSTRSSAMRACVVSRASTCSRTTTTSALTRSTQAMASRARAGHG